MPSFSHILMGLLFAGLLFGTAAATAAISPTTEYSPGPVPGPDAFAIPASGAIDPHTAGLFEAWETLAPIPAARVFCAVASSGNYVFVIGGTSDAGGSTRTDTMYRYNTSNNTWETMASMPAALKSIDAVTIGGKIYVPGDETTASTFVYDVPGDTWSVIPANNGYSPRFQYNAVANGMDVVVLGGLISATSTTEVWQLDTTTGTWSPGVALPDARNAFGAATNGSHIVVTGGVYQPGFTPYMTTWVFDGTAWNAGAGVPDNSGAYPRWSYAADGQDSEGNLWIAGGRRDTNWAVLGDTGVYHTGNNTWNATPDLPALNQARVYNSGAVASDGYFYVAGGRNDAGDTIYDSFERLQVEHLALEARFSATPLTGTAPLNVTFTDSSPGQNITGRVWDFGDGNSTWSATSTRFTHGYGPGSYSVNLTVINASGTSSLLRNAYINVTLPVNSIRPASGSRGTIVKVKNLSGDYFENGANVTLAKGAKKIRGKAVTVVNPAKITCKFKIPAKAAKGKWNVTVMNPGGISGTLANGFKVKA